MDQLGCRGLTAEGWSGELGLALPIKSVLNLRVFLSVAWIPLVHGIADEVYGLTRESWAYGRCYLRRF